MARGTFIAPDESGVLLCARLLEPHHISPPFRLHLNAFTTVYYVKYSYQPCSGKDIIMLRKCVPPDTKSCPSSLRSSVCALAASYPGSYQSTCTGCTLNDQVLSCQSCSQTDGLQNGPVSTSVTSGAPANNCNGAPQSVRSRPRQNQVVEGARNRFPFLLLGFQRIGWCIPAGVAPEDEIERLFGFCPCDPSVSCGFMSVAEQHVYLNTKCAATTCASKKLWAC